MPGKRTIDRLDFEVFGGRGRKSYCYALAGIEAGSVGAVDALELKQRGTWGGVPLAMKLLVTRNCDRM